MSKFEQEFTVASLDFAAAGQASSQIKKLLQLVGYQPLEIRRASIAAYEMEMNMVIHGNGGILKVNLVPAAIELTAQDKGPGIPDIDLAMQEGYSTAPPNIREMGFGAGMGLPNIKRCTDFIEIKSEVGKGTMVRVIINASQK
ncbi:ATP-binding protein [Desulfitibacter alkalitolerans]|uniref:ATP-binding protein n=1 Tax=Desulfitibacter alkalitolerans TaxID=264641 RepID=UPI0005596537|nr:ATP-binding protein [Desulfitibacter alkalitolerans]